MAAVLVSAALVAGCTTAASTDDLLGVVIDPPQSKPSFQLTDTNGDVYDFAAETEGKLTLLYFGYLNCPDICPVHLAQIAETFDQAPDVARDAEVVFVSVDPNRDSPDEIRAFLDNFDSRFVGLTGSQEELEAAQNAAGVPVAVFVGDGEDYTVNHAAQVIAYAPDGLNYSVYPFGVRQSQWNNDLALLAQVK
ncbi:MAG TPA: SCO family protein [Acidimicrobiia bacterium]|nr:SCO family protein [Acidimicrobiia bacterium]